jgi:hypothetical protein
MRVRGLRSGLPFKPNAYSADVILEAESVPPPADENEVPR